MSLICHSYVTRMSFVSHSYVLVCIRMPLVCTRMALVCSRMSLVFVFVMNPGECLFHLNLDTRFFAFMLLKVWDKIFLVEREKCFLL